MVKTASFKRLILRAVLRRVARWSSAWSRSPIRRRSPNSTTCSALSSGGTVIWATSFVCTVRKLIASDGIRGPKHCTNSGCTARKSSSTSATPCTCGSGTFRSWIFRKGSKATTRRSAWTAAGTPPEFCGGPIGYRLMLKRQREGAAMSDPVRLEAGWTGHRHFRVQDFSRLGRNHSGDHPKLVARITPGLCAGISETTQPEKADLGTQDSTGSFDPGLRQCRPEIDIPDPCCAPHSPPLAGISVRSMTSVIGARTFRPMRSWLNGQTRLVHAAAVLRKIRMSQGQQGTGTRRVGATTHRHCVVTGGGLSAAIVRAGSGCTFRFSPHNNIEMCRGAANDKLNIAQTAVG